MAVNENDRVSTRRLKEFWQTAKTWIQNFVSDEIDTSEETMSSTMDTKILAAKPNYRMPNTNDQIGVGYGANVVEKSYFALSVGTGVISYSTFYNAFTQSSFPHSYYAIKRFLTYLSDQNESRTDGKMFQTLFSLMAGKMSVFPPIMSEFTSTFSDEIPDEYFNSTFTEFVYNDSVRYGLISPVFDYNGHTYQTRIFGATGVTSEIYVDLKTDGGDFERITSGNIIIIACFDDRNPICNPLTGYIASYSVGENKLSSNAVTETKIANKAVSKSKLETKLSNFLTSDVYENTTGTASNTYYYYCTQHMQTIRETFYGLYDELVSTNKIELVNNILKINVNGWLSTYGISNFKRLAKMALKTDNGYYESYGKLQGTGGSGSMITALEFTPFDDSFVSHLSENNALLIFDYSSGFSVKTS